MAETVLNPEGQKDVGTTSGPMPGTEGESSASSAEVSKAKMAKSLGSTGRCGFRKRLDRETIGIRTRDVVQEQSIRSSRAVLGQEHVQNGLQEFSGEVRGNGGPPRWKTTGQSADCLTKSLPADWVGVKASQPGLDFSEGGSAQQKQVL